MTTTYPTNLDPAYNRLLWVDVETSGLDLGARYASLLQVAAIVTDVSGVPLAPPFERVVRHTRAEVAFIRPQVSAFVNDMHEQTGLWERLTSEEAQPLGQVDADLFALVSSVAPEARQARLAGNSPVLDIAFSRRFLPATAAHLHYRLADVTWLGTARVFSGLAHKRPDSLAGSVKHEALSDILNAVAEYRTLFALDAWIAGEIASGALDVASAPPEVRCILTTPEGRA